MTLRVIGGSAKGMKLKSVPGKGTRPMMDRAKEALFNIIGEDILEAGFLDLFGGTGSVGIEALSRGAAYAVFVESHRRAVQVIRGNLTHTRLDARARVLHRSAFDILAQAPSQRYDFIYAAPPQYQNLWTLTLEALDANPHWHHSDTTVIVQIDPREYDSARTFNHLIEYQQRRYGRTLLLFYRFAESAGDDD